MDEIGDKYNKEDSNEYHIENINKLKLDIITESFKGLENIGNTCYLNSALQILIHCKEIIKELQLSIYNQKNIITKVFKYLYVRFYNFQTTSINKSKINENFKKYINPFEFKQKFSKKSNRFAFGQPDTIEFIRILLEDINK